MTSYLEALEKRAEKVPQVLKGLSFNPKETLALIKSLNEAEPNKSSNSTPLPSPSPRSL